MEIHIQVIHPKDFLIIKADGVLDKDASIALISKIMTDHPKGEDLLIDLRDIYEITTSISDVMEIVAFMLETENIFRYKIAILGDQSKSNQPGFLDDYAYNRGINLKTFSSFEMAIMWLMKTGEG